MGKYIIELKQGETAYKTVNSNGCPMIGLLHPAPYTEPDLDAIRKEAFDEGYQEGMQLSIDDAKLKEAYQKGLSDAWDAAKKVVALSTVDRRKVFGSEYMYSILEKHTASEAIEKIQQYEQEKEEQLQVGDYVKLKCGMYAVYMGGVNGSNEYNVHLCFNDGSCGVHSKSEIECKTGRHFPEIAEVLQKMREG